MIGLSDLLRNHIEYTVWATNRLLKAGSELTPEELQHDFGTADKSIQGTLAHLLRSEQGWLRRIRESTPPAAPSPDETWDLVVQTWPGLHEEWRNWVSTLSDTAAESTLKYKGQNGEQWEQPLWQVVLHVVNHSTHHRGQVSGFLRALGKTPPPLDFIKFVRE